MAWRNGLDGPGGYFRWRAGELVAERVDPVADPPGWVDWPLPGEPEKKPDDAPVLKLRWLGLLGGGDVVHAAGDVPEVAGPEAKEGGAAGGDGGTSVASMNAEMAKTAIEKYREALKWLVVTAGALAVALIGTAPLSGLPAAIREEGIRGGAAFGFLLTIAGLATILLAVAWVSRPVIVTTNELASQAPAGRLRWWRPRWRTTLQREYAQSPGNYLDGRACDLAEFAAYRAGWLGTVSDIERVMDQTGDIERSAKLKRYLSIAKERVKEGAETAITNLERGAVYKVRSRAQVALAIIVIAAVATVWGFLIYLGNTEEVQDPPFVDEVQLVEPDFALGDDVQLRVTATGTGFRYGWRHDNEAITPAIPGFSGEDGPVLTIEAFDEQDAGDYTATVTDSEGKTAFSIISLSTPKS
jgi:hypothetical protein